MMNASLSRLIEAAIAASMLACLTPAAAPIMGQSFEPGELQVEPRFSVDAFKALPNEQSTPKTKSVIERSETGNETKSDVEFDKNLGFEGFDNFDAVGGFDQLEDPEQDERPAQESIQQEESSTRQAPRSVQMPSFGSSTRNIPDNHDHELSAPLLPDLPEQLPELTAPGPRFNEQLNEQLEDRLNSPLDSDLDHLQVQEDYAPKTLQPVPAPVIEPATPTVVVPVTPEASALLDIQVRPGDRNQTYGAFHTVERMVNDNGYITKARYIFEATTGALVAEWFDDETIIPLALSLIHI